ncbi:hypothetical protein F9L16_10145 [Agarivorans sp. B2Z047]|uniref:hypothetical protein n=1 Tax=Agarivorans sp. B2Z047 TaxID=2652721 RepID=UPI00128D09F0|nr:hypothetical protein [Agarivorans sp. B2Z047]MPW29357.1 hypothetical protein [Agarivorans sp. B2Z047]UQN44945.1 hypothetical protein LQZ07_10910 [Agarivorans sp. B2Z047]
MYSLKDIKERSESEDELVVGYSDAIKLLDIFEQNNTQAHGWEGWLKYEDGKLSHSQKYQGTSDLSALPNTSAISLIRSTIMRAHAEWQEKPEVSNASLLFCITINT